MRVGISNRTGAHVCVLFMLFSRKVSSALCHEACPLVESK